MNVPDLLPCVGHKNPDAGIYCFYVIELRAGSFIPVPEQPHKLLTLSTFSEAK
jgi:hypothetical protein